MAEVRRKYDLRPRLNAPNFGREETTREPENTRRDAPGGIEYYKGGTSFKSFDYQRLVFPIREEAKEAEKPKSLRVAGANEKLSTPP
jgi:hypothetical protein